MSLSKKTWVMGSLVVVSFSSAFGSGCSIKKNMDEMHDATVSMDKKMDQTNDTAGKMNEKMDVTNEQMAATKRQIDAQVVISRELQAQTAKLHDLSQSLYRDLRQGNSLTIRSQRLEALERSSPIEAKISEAGKYFMAFEFQLYKDAGFDNDGNMERLKLDAINEFTRDVRRYSFGGNTIDLTTSVDGLKNLFALSVAMHRINPNEEEIYSSSAKTEVTILSMIKDTLAKKSAFDVGNGKPNEWEHAILANEQDMVYMLQLRTNFLGGMVLEKLSGVQEAGFLRKAKMALFHWDSDFTSPNLFELQEYTKWMNESLKTRDFLSKNGYASRIDNMLEKLFVHMNAQTSAVSAGSKPRIRLHAEAEQDLLNSINKFRY